MRLDPETRWKASVRRLSEASRAAEKAAWEKAGHAGAGRIALEADAVFATEMARFFQAAREEREAFAALWDYDAAPMGASPEQRGEDGGQTPSPSR